MLKTEYTMGKNVDLFSDFPALSDEAWRAKVIEDLKGKDFAETLVWTDAQGIDHEPYYRASDIKGNPLVAAIQKAQQKSGTWKVAQSLQFEGSEAELKEAIEQALENGVEEVLVYGLDEAAALKMSKHFTSKNKALRFQLESIPQSKNFFFQLDPIASYLKSGVSNVKAAELKSIFEAKAADKNDRFLLVDGSIYKSAAANVVQEMACVLQHALAYFDELTTAGLSAKAIADRMEFKLAFDNSYFLEIAKSRALRYLIDKLFKAYEVETQAYIWGAASMAYLSHKDFYTNLLRTTTQSMAAVVGNCDKVSTLAFDSLQASSKLGLRMAKNIPLILSEEAYLSEVSDMAAGSYYIESLSASFAEKAWDEFLKMEAAGGLIKLFESGELQKELDASWQQQQIAYKKEGRSMVGVNKYINEQADTLTVKADGFSGKGLKMHLLAKEID